MRPGILHLDWTNPLRIRDGFRWLGQDCTYVRFGGNPRDRILDIKQDGKFDRNGREWNKVGLQAGSMRYLAANALV